MWLLHNYSSRAEAYSLLSVTVTTPSFHHHFMFNGLETSPNCHGVCFFFYYFLLGMQGSLLHIGLSSVHTVINSLTVTSSFYTSCMTLQPFPKKMLLPPNNATFAHFLILTRAANILKTAQNIVTHKKAGSLFCPISRILAMFLFFVKWLHMCSNSFDGFVSLKTETLGARVNCLFFF